MFTAQQTVTKQNKQLGLSEALVRPVSVMKHSDDDDDDDDE